MAGGGQPLSRAGPRGPDAAGDHRQRTRASARLGSILRAVLLAPRDGFPAAFKAADRRSSAGLRPPEGLAPFVLAALGGAALFLLWLKLGALLGLRQSTRADYRPEFLVAAVALGAALGLAGQALWGSVGVHVVRPLGGSSPARDLRTVWGASAFPNTFALALLPVDLFISGPAIFTSGRIGDSLATAWAALSISLALALALWSLWLFSRGVQMATGVGTARAWLLTAVGGLCLVGVVGVVFGAAAALGGPA